jgi:hypothetical protein
VHASRGRERERNRVKENVCTLVRVLKLSGRNDPHACLPAFSHQRSVEFCMVVSL